MKTPGTPSAPTAAPTTGCATDALILWRFSDGRRGHDAQSLGLAEAIARRHPARIVDLPVPPRTAAAMAFVRGCFPPGESLPDPHFLIGAGRRTHLPLLAARRARGGRAVVLMRPGLPAAWFDHCLIPDHDRPRPRPNILVTRGPLNRVVPGTGPRRGPGIILVGGASRHYTWPEAEILAELRWILARHDGIWIVTDSPRTPAAFRTALREIAGEAYVAWEECGPEWLPARLAEAPEAWVTADSLSMIYEALTAGAAVGIVDLPPARRRSRAAVALDDLVGRGWVTRARDRPQEAVLPRPPEILGEADRCAAILLDEFLPCGSR